jgi:hypothetical protein
LTGAADGKTERTTAGLKTIAGMNAENLMRLAADMEDYALRLARGPVRVELAQVVAHWRSKAQGEASASRPSRRPDRPGTSACAVHNPEL